MMADGSDHNWHWRKNVPPKEDARKGFFRNLAAAIRSKGPAPDKASLLQRRFSIAYALGAWTLCVGAGVTWYFAPKDKALTNSSESSSQKMPAPDQQWSRKTPVGTFSYEAYRRSETNPNWFQKYKKRIKAKLNDWWDGDASTDKKHTDHNKGTT